MTVDQAARSVPLMPPGLVQSGLFLHREGLFRRRLDAKAQALFQPGEQIVVAFDGVTRFPRVRSYTVGFSGAQLGIAVSGAFELLHGDAFDRASGRWHVIVGLVLLCGGVALRAGFRLLGSRAVMVAMTTLGVVECRTDWLNRPRGIVQRGPVVEPEFFEGGRHNVGIGPVDVYTDRASELMLWRTVKRVQPRRLEHSRR